MAKIAVEPTLGDVIQTLQANGHEVVSMDNLENVSCCVISGQDENMMGVANAVTNAAVINARGMTAQEVLERVYQCL